jgi:hypothetical protein
MSIDGNIPRVSAAKVAYHKAQLDKLFGRAAAKDFLEMAWAIDALIAGKPEVAVRHLSFPSLAQDQSMTSTYAIHRWELETLLIQLLLAPETTAAKDSDFSPAAFASVAELVNRLRKLEDVEAGLYLAGSTFNAVEEMHRIAQRQFHWQTGYFNRPQMYRYAYIYGQGKCAEYFAAKHGISVADFILVGFVLFTQAVRLSWLSRDISAPDIGLTAEIMSRALPLLSTSLPQARVDTKELVDKVTSEHGTPIPTAFLPSILRRTPLVSVADASDIIAPIPEMILLRVTAGLYYDVVGGGQHLLNDANDRFEAYLGAYFTAMMNRFKVRRAYRYEIKKGQGIDTPDLLVEDRDELALVVECKATKLTYMAQFAEDPVGAQKKQYAQIIKAVLQLWRFFSHVRRGLLKEPVVANTAAMVVTLDSFLMMSQPLTDKIIAEANALADAEGDIVAEDRRSVIFTPTQALEGAMSVSTEDLFRSALKASELEKYKGWQFREICRAQASGDPGGQNPYPFQLDDLLPWWNKIHDLKRAANAAE